jgi:hypothetical protein
MFLELTQMAQLPRKSSFVPKLNARITALCIEAMPLDFLAAPVLLNCFLIVIGIY